MQAKFETTTARDRVIAYSPLLKIVWKTDIQEDEKKILPATITDNSSLALNTVVNASNLA